MAKVSKKHRTISIAKLLGLEPTSDREDVNFLLFKDFLVGLNQVMMEKGVGMTELARRMNISRQAVYEKFSGKNTSMVWIQRACQALGVEAHIFFTEKRKAA